MWGDVSSEAPLTSLEPPAVQGLRFQRGKPLALHVSEFMNEWSDWEVSVTPMTDSESHFLVNVAKLANTRIQTCMRTACMETWYRKQNIW